MGHGVSEGLSVSIDLTNENLSRGTIEERSTQILVYRCEDLVVRNLSLLDCAYDSIRVIQSKRVHMHTL
jgi:hypothetical protein